MDTDGGDECNCHDAHVTKDKRIGRRGKYHFQTRNSESQPIQLK